MDASRVAEEVYAAMQESWPDGVIEEFDRDESYFHDIREKLERDLRRIPEVSLVWQTEAEPARVEWDDDDEGELPFDADFQSYHVFFLSPQGEAFEFETESDDLEDPDPEDPEAEPATVTHSGTGRYGCSVAVSLVTPFAAVGFAEYAFYEDGSYSTPDPCNFAYLDEESGNPVDPAARSRDILGESAFVKLENLRAQTTKILAKHSVVVLDHAILDLPAPDLKADGDVFLDGPLAVRDAFFFRGV